jgi:hypothetical protein
MISVTLVLDDFHRPQLAELKRYFSVVNPFKSHHVLRNPSIFAYGKHHRYEVRRALAKVSVRLFDLSHHLSEWSSLYADLTGRHGFSGVHDFPSSHFDALCLLDGTQAIGAWLEDRLVSAHIWMSDGKYVHSHLAASSSDGYASRAAYAVNDASIRHFQGADLLNFGGAAGAGDDPCDGLARFKRGFANDLAPAFICGAVLDRPRYDELARRTAAPPDTLFFPAYRTGTG